MSDSSDSSHRGGGPPFRLRVRVAARDEEKMPREDDAIGEHLSAVVAGALARGLPRPAFLAIRPEQVDWFDVVPLLQAGQPHAQHMLSAIAGQDGVECAALIGTFRLRAPRPGVEGPRAILCFIEWPDNRWWTSWRLIGDDQSPLGDDPQVRRAVDGFPRPGGVGGWFSLARRLGLKLRMEPAAPAEPTVH